MAGNSLLSVDQEVTGNDSKVDSLRQSIEKRGFPTLN